MMETANNAYGLWLLVVLNSAIFIMFAFCFFKPNTSRDWRLLVLSQRLLSRSLLRCMAFH